MSWRWRAPGGARRPRGRRGARGGRRAGARYGSPPGEFAAAISLGVSAAFAGFLISGLMEWNLGDEELLDLLCVLVGIAFGAVSWARHRAARAGAEPLAIGGAPDQLGEAARAVGVTSRLR